jgi:hypothetical protein
VNALNRLRTLQAENESIGFEMLLEKGRFAALASRHEDGTAPRAVSSFNLFQTPQDIAERMASMLPKDAQAILEPSAGLGRLYKAIRARNKQAHISLVDQSADCCRELYAVTEQDELTAIKQADFLSVEPAYEGNCGLIVKQLPYAFYDAVIMNPPFKRGLDVKHILHALGFLKSGGLLVALCYNGVKKNRDLKPLCDTWEMLPKGSFKSEGTGAEVVLLTIKSEV